MPANGSTQHAHVVSRPDAAGDHSAPKNDLLQRVVSVSPHLHGSLAAEFSDQKVVNDGRTILESLRALIDQSGALSEKLVTLATNASESEAQAAQAVVHLQERLRLSAQMLKAFQSQIGRIDHSLEQLKAQERRAEAAEARAQQRQSNVQSRIEAALLEFSQRLDEMMHAAVERINRMVDERAADAASRLSDDSPAPIASPQPQDLHEIATTVRDMAQRLATLTEKSAPQIVIEEKPQNAPSTSEISKQMQCPEIHVSPPLRLHTWASRG